jgi:hypothetical protein
MWIANYGDGTITKMAASDGKILAVLAGPFGPEGIAFDGASIWTAAPFAEIVSKH